MVELPARALAHWDTGQQDWVVEPGRFRLVAARNAGATGIGADLPVG